MRPQGLRDAAKTAKERRQRIAAVRWMLSYMKAVLQGKSGAAEIGIRGRAMQIHRISGPTQFEAIVWDYRVMMSLMTSLLLEGVGEGSVEKSLEAIAARIQFEDLERLLWDEP